jgi:hypothetical protein
MKNNNSNGDMGDMGDVPVLPTTTNDRTDHDVTDEDTEVVHFSGRYNCKSCPVGDV